MTASLRHASRTLATLFAALVLTACGGGGSGDSCRSIDPSRTGCPVAASAAAQLTFESASPTNIAIKGTGGPGRQETSLLSFRVKDKNGTPVGDALINFTLLGATSNTAGTGGLSLSSGQARSDSNGLVTTSVVAGIVNTPVRVSATIANSSPLVTSVSDELVISTGIPDQDNFALSAGQSVLFSASSPTSCADSSGTNLNVSMADHFHNPVPDGTAVSFTAEGGVIDASCRTVNGRCSVNYCLSNFRPVDGRITIMAYALGEESFKEDPTIQNGINRYDDSESFQDLCEPVRYDNAVSDAEANFSANVPFYSAAAITRTENQASLLCPPPPAGSIYIDTNGDGRFNATGDRIYNGVLRFDPVTGQTVANSKSPTVHVRRSVVLVVPFNGAEITLLGGAANIALDACVNGTPFANTPTTVQLAIRDTNKTVIGNNSLPGNPLPSGTKVEFITSNGKVISAPSSPLASSASPSQAAWTYNVVMQSDASQSSAAGTPAYSCSNPVTSGALTVRVTTPTGTVTEKSIIVND